MSIIEVGARGGAIALLLLLAALLLRDRRGVPAAGFSALFALGAAANLVSAAPPLAADPSLWILPFRILAVGNPAVFWVVSSAMFDDEFAPSWRHAVAWLGLVALNVCGAFGYGAQFFLLSKGLALICVLLALWHVLIGRADDLVEARRRLRVVFVVWVGLFTSAMILSATAFHGGEGHPAFGYADTFGTLAIAAFFAATLLSVTQVEAFLALPTATVDPPTAQDLPAPEQNRPAPATLPEDARETALLAALRRQLEQNRAYREDALSIAALASKLGVPEYRLRRLINQRLGHRNFNAFLNGYRLDEVIAALADPSKVEVTILTIALDAGFQSIGPFNRSFKARTGVTPTEYRRLNLPRSAESGNKTRVSSEIG